MASGDQENLGWQDELSLVDANRYMLRNGPFDVTFTFENSKIKPFQGLKSLIAARSSLFECWFDDHQIKQFQVPEHVDPHCFRALMSYIYLDEVDLSMDTAFQLRATARWSQVHSLSRRCLLYLTKNLTAKTVAKVLEISSSNQDHEVHEMCVEKVLRDGANIIRADEFLDVKLETLKEILTIDFDMNSEVDIFNRVVQWAESKYTEKKTSITGENIRAILGDAMYCVRLPTLTSMELLTHILPTDILTEMQEIALLKAIADGRTTGFASKPRKPENMIGSNSAKGSKPEKEAAKLKVIKGEGEVHEMDKFRGAYGIQSLLQIKVKKAVKLHEVLLHAVQASSRSTHLYVSICCAEDQNKRKMLVNNMDPEIEVCNDTPMYRINLERHIPEGKYLLYVEMCDAKCRKVTCSQPSVMDLSDGNIIARSEFPRTNLFLGWRVSKCM